MLKSIQEHGITNTQPKIIECWTDASYSPKHNISVVGYKIGKNQTKTKTQQLKNTQAELEAIRICIFECETLYPNSKIIIYTDCQRALTKLYPTFVKIIKVQGHSKKSLKNNVDLIFSSVDKIVRKTLRNTIDNIKKD